jgi:uncharacterized membrane protein
LVQGIFSAGTKFLKELMPTRVRATNLTRLAFFVLGCIGIFQFLLADKRGGGLQDVASWVGDLGLSLMGFLVLLLPILALWLLQNAVASVFGN